MTKLPNLSEASDQEVVAWAREGDEDAYREMLRRYGPPVFDLIYRMVSHRELAQDLTQETFVKAFRALDRHDPADNRPRDSPKEPASYVMAQRGRSSWLYSESNPPTGEVR